MTQWLQENSAALSGLGGLATVIAAVVAIFTLMRAGLDSASRTRPYVVAEFEIPDNAFKQLDLVVRNAGPTAARNLRVSFEPEFDPDAPRPQLGQYVTRRYAQPISVLGPGQTLSSVLWVDPQDESKSDLGETLTVRVRYDSPRWRIRDYDDVFVLNRVVYTAQVFSVQSDSELGSLRSIAKHLKAIANARS